VLPAAEPTICNGDRQRLIEEGTMRRRTLLLAVRLPALAAYGAAPEPAPPGPAPAPQPSPAAPDVPGLAVYASRYDVAETSSRVQDGLRVAGMVTAVVDHAANAAGVGEQLRATVLVIGGAPPAGTPIMLEAQRAAVELPQKFLSWQAEDETVYLAHNTAEYVAARTGLPADSPALALLRTASLGIATQATGAAGPVATGAATGGPDGYLVERTADTSVTEAIARYERAFADRGLAPVATVDHATGAAAIGVSLRPTQVILVGNPRVGTPLLQAAQTIGIDLPVRFAAWEDATGAVHVAHPDIRAFAQRHGVTGADDAIGMIEAATRGAHRHRHRSRRLRGNHHGAGGVPRLNRRRPRDTRPPHRRRRRCAPLAARLDLPAGPPLGFALLAHCFTCSKDQIGLARIARGLTARGVGVLRIDFTGLGESGGSFAESTFTVNADDLVRAADRLRAEYGAPSLLVGHSFGGAAVIAAADRIPEARAVATIGAPFSPDHVTHLFDAARDDIDTDGAAAVCIAGRSFRVGRDFLADVADQPQRARIAALDRPLLVLHAPDDDIVDAGNARRIVDAAGPVASFVALDGADHLLTRAADADRVAALVAAWAGPYLDGAKAAEPGPEPGTVEVTETGAGRFTQRIRTAEHEWAADEPTSAGGTGSAPDPYQLLLSALGACTTMTMRMYAERKGWNLRRSTITLTHDRLHAADCVTCETDTGQVDRIVREIHLDGDLDDTQRAKLLAIAERCPVHRTLHSETLIETDPV